MELVWLGKGEGDKNTLDCHGAVESNKSVGGFLELIWDLLSGNQNWNSFEKIISVSMHKCSAKAIFILNFFVALITVCLLLVKNLFLWSVLKESKSCSHKKNDTFLFWGTTEGGLWLWCWPQSAHNTGWNNSYSSWSRGRKKKLFLFFFWS